MNPKVSDEDQRSQRPTMILVGPGRHFGADLIRRFLDEGFAVGVMSARQETLEALRSDLKLGAAVAFVRVDVTDYAHFQDALTQMVHQLGRLECLIYNPKISVKGGGLSTRPRDLATSLQVNVTGALAAVQAAVPLMTGSEKPAIILTGGGYKDRGHPEKFALQVGKAGLHAVARGLTDSLKLKGVQLQTVIINGAIRADSSSLSFSRGSSRDLADFFWGIFRDQDRHVYRYPPRSPDGTQLTLF
ncbi:MAG: SDR family NAD(P)-dependent oxidoreductase [Caulobacteraceae bacterium]|nr:SDR family NAD(P)-dependent oxidoreductase [Caulobacteraceae bacterium]